MATDERYNGWTNRETWAVALHINNDQGWQESVHEDVREGDYGYGESLTLDEAREAYFNSPGSITRRAGEIIRENVERVVCWDFGREDDTMPANLSSDLVGRALDRVDWDEIGASFLADVAEQDSYENGED